MSAILDAVRQQWSELTDGTRMRPPVSFLLHTPRFRASANAILILVDQDHRPVMVAKIPRLQGDGCAIRKEAYNLNALKSHSTVPRNSVPNNIALLAIGQTPALLESFVEGRPMDQALVARDPDACTQAIFKWLVKLHSGTKKCSDNERDWHRRLVSGPLASLRSAFKSREEQVLIERTDESASSLRFSGISLVFEHGDLSSPNLLMLPDGSLGVLDWEVSDPDGLPMLDLFMALNYVGCAKRGARSDQQKLAAFREAFSSRNSMTLLWMQRYAAELRISNKAIGQLFSVSWPLYLARLLDRLTRGQPDSASDETVVWLRNSIYYAFWQCTAELTGNFDL